MAEDFDAFDAKDALALNILSDDLPALQHSEHRLNTAEAQTTEIETDLLEALGRYRSMQRSISELEKERLRVVVDLNASNQELVTLRQELAILERRLQDANTEFERVEGSALKRKLRRERAKIKVQIEDKNQLVEVVTQRAEQTRQAIVDNDTSLKKKRLETRAAMQELDQFQHVLPTPELFLDVFGYRLSVASANMQLEKNVDDWRAAVVHAVQPLLTFYAWVQEGRYRLDEHHHMIGGRESLVVDGIYALVAVSELALAKTLIHHVADAEVRFLDVPSVFRLWCLALWLEQNDHDLAGLVQRYQYAEGEHELYASLFAALLTKNQADFNLAMRMLHRRARQANDVKFRGFELYDFSALATKRCAHIAGLNNLEEIPGEPAQMLVI